MATQNEPDIRKAVLAALAPIIEATRTELRDREDADVPKTLESVARRSDRRLPPPIARAVLRELSSNEELRASVLTRMSKDQPPTGSHLAFLEDPQKGIAMVAKEVDDKADDTILLDMTKARERISELEHDLAIAKRRLRAERSNHSDELAQLRRSKSEKHEREVQQNVELRESVKALESESDHHADRIPELESAIEAIAEKLRISEAKQARKKRADSEAVAPTVDEGTPAPSDPIELAQMLDKLERTTRPFRSASRSVDSPPGHERLTIPPGIAPDTAEVLASLLEQSPLRLIIDGYNVSGELHGKRFSTREARDTVVQEAGSLARRTEAEIIVVFDGPETSDGSAFRSNVGVIVRFSEGDEADDVIEELVLAGPDRTIVITNDKLLRQRCTVDGCVPIWSTAMLAYLGSDA